jgi:hypothetical protein
LCSQRAGVKSDLGTSILVSQPGWPDLPIPGMLLVNQLEYLVLSGANSEVEPGRCAPAVLDLFNFQSISLPVERLRALGVSGSRIAFHQIRHGLEGDDRVVAGVDNPGAPRDLGFAPDQRALQDHIPHLSSIFKN